MGGGGLVCGFQIFHPISGQQGNKPTTMVRSAQQVIQSSSDSNVNFMSVITWLTCRLMRRCLLFRHNAGQTRGGSPQRHGAGQGPRVGRRPLLLLFKQLWQNYRNPFLHDLSTSTIQILVTAFFLPNVLATIYPLLVSFACTYFPQQSTDVLNNGTDILQECISTKTISIKPLRIFTSLNSRWVIFP